MQKCGHVWRSGQDVATLDEKEPCFDFPPDAGGSERRHCWEARSSGVGVLCIEQRILRLSKHFQAANTMGAESYSSSSNPTLFWRFLSCMLHFYLGRSLAQTRHVISKSA